MCLLRLASPGLPTGPYPGLKISSALCSAALVLACVQAAYAQVHVPSDEYVSYVDANGIYTVIGNVQNDGGQAVSPTITVSVQDGDLVRTASFQHQAVPAGQELPFRIKMPGVPPGAVLLEPEVSYVRASSPPVSLSVIYDDTLVLHEDGSISGRVINTGDRALHNPSVWAVVHGDDGAIDVARNHLEIGTLEPGDSASFAMYPDPTVASMVSYYSCFAPSQNSVYPLKADRNGTPYDLRYESGAWFYRPQFSEDGTEVTIQTTNSYPLVLSANLEIPAVTRQEVFEVYLNGEPVRFLQSIDEMGMWHLVFDIRKHSQDEVTVRGFVPGPVLPPLVPEYFRDDAAQWSSGLADDDAILYDLRLLADRKMIPPGLDGDPLLPAWLGPVMGWYGAGSLTHDEFLAMASYLVERGVILLG